MPDSVIVTALDARIQNSQTECEGAGAEKATRSRSPMRLMSRLMASGVNEARFSSKLKLYNKDKVKLF
jgi:hypothetical protein